MARRSPVVDAVGPRPPTDLTLLRGTDRFVSRPAARAAIEPCRSRLGRNPPRQKFVRARSRRSSSRRGQWCRWTARRTSRPAGRASRETSCTPFPPRRARWRPGSGPASTASARTTTPRCSSSSGTCCARAPPPGAAQGALGGRGARARRPGFRRGDRPRRPNRHRRRPRRSPLRRRPRHLTTPRGALGRREAGRARADRAHRRHRHPHQRVVALDLPRAGPGRLCSRHPERRGPPSRRQGGAGRQDGRHGGRREGPEVAGRSRPLTLTLVPRAHLGVEAHRTRLVDACGSILRCATMTRMAVRNGWPRLRRSLVFHSAVERCWPGRTACSSVCSTSLPTPPASPSSFESPIAGETNQMRTGRGSTPPFGRSTVPPADARTA